MVLSEKGMQLAKSLARDLVRVEKEKRIAERKRRAQATRESFESFGRAIRNVQNAYVEGFCKPINNAMKAMSKGFHS